MEFRLLSIFGHNWVHIWEHLRASLKSESWKAECELKRWWRIAQVDSVNGFQTHSTILEVPLLLLARLQISGSLVWKWICLVHIWSPVHPIWWLCIIWNLRNKLAGLRDARVEIILIMESLIHLHWFCHNISNYMSSHGIWKTLPAVEWFPEQSQLRFQKSLRGHRLQWCHLGMWRWYTGWSTQSCSSSIKSCVPEFAQKE